MKWVMVLLELVIPAGIAVYTINFGRWMAGRKNKSGAFAAYFIAGLSFLSAAFVLLRNNG